MGRHRSPLKQALDVKSKLFTLFRFVTLDMPALRRLCSFYPEYKIPSDESNHILHRSAYHYPWLQAPYDAARALMLDHNVDSLGPSDWSQTDATERYISIIRDVIVPGQFTLPVDPRAAALISSDQTGLANWNRARPSISAWTRKSISDDLTLVVPKINHFGHLLTDFLMPYFFALHLIGQSQGDKLNIITSDKPNELIQAFVAAVRLAGYQVRHVETKIWQEIHVPRLLYATTHSRNREWKFATPEILDLARGLLLKALPAHAPPRSTRIFLMRGDTRTRQVAGEIELAHQLQKIGFTPLVGRWSNLAEQISAFQNADVIVGAHGAGLANVLWSKPGAVLVELSARHARKTTGLHWAASAGLAYVPLTGSDEGPLQSFSIDPDAIFARVQTILEEKAPAILPDGQGS